MTLYRGPEETGVVAGDKCAIEKPTLFILAAFSLFSLLIAWSLLPAKAPR